MIMQDKRLLRSWSTFWINAIKQRPDGSKIFIRLQKEMIFVRMEIEDQGIGIPQNEYHVKFFKRFYRGSSRRSWKRVACESDFSIGEIIEKHGGYNHMVTSAKKKKKHVYDLNYHMLVTLWAEILQFCKTSALFFESEMKDYPDTIWI